MFATKAVSSELLFLFIDGEQSLDGTGCVVKSSLQCIFLRESRRIRCKYDSVVVMGPCSLACLEGDMGSAEGSGG